MPGSSSTSSSKRWRGYHRYATAVLCALGATVLVSVALLYVRPQTLYWRAFEYFNEIALREGAAAIVPWQGSESGDLSRNFVFRYQDRWPTYVSTDSEGFRSTPCFVGDGYQIVVHGDSNSLGSGLADSDTIAWRMAEVLDRPVFNGSRNPFSLARILGNPRIAKASIVVEIVTAHLIEPGIFKAGFGDIRAGSYVSLDARPRLTRVPFKRYFVPGMISRHFSFASDIWRPRSWFTEEMPTLVQEIYQGDLTVSWAPDRTGEVVDSIVRYARAVEASGHAYVFVPLPVSRYPHNTVPIHAYAELVARLREQGVHALDLHDAFWEGRHRSLYRRTDTHISPIGADLAARRISAFLGESGLLDRLPDISCARASNDGNSRPRR